MILYIYISYICYILYTLYIYIHISDITHMLGGLEVEGRPAADNRKPHEAPALGVKPGC